MLQKYALEGTGEALRNYYGVLKREQQIQILGKKVKVEMACEPTDVYWEHQGIKTSRKLCSRLASGIFDTFITIILFSIVIYLLYLQD